MCFEGQSGARHHSFETWSCVERGLSVADIFHRVTEKLCERDPRSTSSPPFVFNYVKISLHLGRGGGMAYAVVSKTTESNLM